MGYNLNRVVLKYRGMEEGPVFPKSWGIQGFLKLHSNDTIHADLLSANITVMDRTCSYNDKGQRSYTDIPAS